MPLQIHPCIYPCIRPHSVPSIIPDSTLPLLRQSSAQPLRGLSTSCFRRPSAPPVTTYVQPWLLASPTPSHLWLYLSLALSVHPWLRLSLAPSVIIRLTSNLVHATSLLYDTKEKGTAIRLVSHIFHSDKQNNSRSPCLFSLLTGSNCVHVCKSKSEEQTIHSQQEVRSEPKKNKSSTYTSISLLYSQWVKGDVRATTTRRWMREGGWRTATAEHAEVRVKLQLLVMDEDGKETSKDSKRIQTNTRTKTMDCNGRTK